MGRLRESISGLVTGLLVLWAPTAQASDHLDSPSVIADPRSDIGDVFAWMAPDRRRLNLVMTIVGSSFSDAVSYRFHVDSGPRFGETVATRTIDCQFEAADELVCRLDGVEVARGDPRGEDGMAGAGGRLRVFAGPRSDPFFNNVRGSRAAYDVAARELRSGAGKDPAGCPHFEPAASSEIMTQWRQTNGGPGANFVSGWTAQALVVSVDLGPVAEGGAMLAVWATTTEGARQIDRMGRPLTGNALLVTLGSEEDRNRAKEEYNAAARTDWSRFEPLIAEGLALYDGFDAECGNQLLADWAENGPGRYERMSALLVDDRLWINSDSGTCRTFFAVELAAVLGLPLLRSDCGGRPPAQDAIDVYRSLLVDGTLASVDDGVDADEDDHSTHRFPFLAGPLDSAP